MTTNNRIKLKSTLASHTQGTVDLASWLEQRGISHDLQKHYRKSGWMESVGTGALTALALQGFAFWQTDRLFIFSHQNTFTGLVQKL
ncbi:MAG: AbiEi antitoxin N-terminal domain-containing protein [Chlorobium sp.]